MELDLRDVLQDWPYDPEHNVRVVVLDEDRSVMQVRLPLGLEQYELDGRPDGYRPEGYETQLELTEARIHSGEGGADIGRDEFAALQAEGILYYYRYLLLFQINDFERVIRDTGHNLRLCDLLETCCSREEETATVLQFRPYIIRMNAMASALLAVQEERHPAALQVLEAAIERIDHLKPVASAVFQFERSRSMSYLQTTLQQMRSKVESGSTDLESELSAALAEENYERAAEIRDQMRNLRPA